MRKCNLSNTCVVVSCQTTTGRTIVNFDPLRVTDQSDKLLKMEIRKWANDYKDDFTLFVIDERRNSRDIIDIHCWNISCCSQL